jgi:UBX domain.
VIIFAAAYLVINQNQESFEFYFRDTNVALYDLKTSFPNQTYTDMKRTLRDYDLTPNATLHMVARKETIT